MKNGNLNDHGQPFSKKQRQASRHMMESRKTGFKKQDEMGPKQRAMLVARGLLKK